MPGPTRATFGNTVFSQGFDFTFGTGIQPSVCSLRTVPHTSSLPQVATLTLWTEGESPLSFPGCALESPQLSVGSGGQIWTLPILDRRWRWREDWGPIYGHYNIIRHDGTYKREKTPQELATLCFDAMGETEYDVSRLPNDARPEIHWDGAHAASQLDQLATSLGCIVVLDPFDNIVKIWPVGQGPALPSGPTQGQSLTPIVAIKPSSIIIEAAPTLFQDTFHLVSVGLDTDDKWRLIDDLSYKPAGGWGTADLIHGFPEITSTYQHGDRTLPTRGLAESTVFRSWRIDGIGEAGEWVPFGINNSQALPESRKDLRIFSVRAEQELDSDGGLRPLPARLFGKWFQIERTFTDTLVAGWQRGEQLQDYTGGFSIDADTGVVTTNEPLVLYQNGGAIPAELRLETSFHAALDGVMDRRSKTINLNPGWGTSPRLIQRPDIVQTAISKRTDDGDVSTTYNTAEVDTRLGYWGDAAVAEYEPQQGQTIRYAKLMPIAPDGLTQQVTWSGGGGRPPSTTVSQGQRHNRYVPPPETQRDRVRTKILEQADKASIGTADVSERMLRYGAGLV